MENLSPARSRAIQSNTIKSIGDFANFCKGFASFWNSEFLRSFELQARVCEVAAQMRNNKHSAIALNYRGYAANNNFCMKQQIILHTQIHEEC